MRSKNYLYLIVGLILLLASALAAAQPTVDLGGKASVTFGVAVDGTLPIAAAELELLLSGAVGAGLFPDAEFTASVLGGYDAATGEATVTLDEGHATLYLGDLELKLGKQRAAWGSTDGINPVDVLNPRDLSFPVDSRKIAVPMLYARYYAPENLRLDAAIIPVFTPSTLPGQAWQPPVTPPPLPPGVNVTQQLPPEALAPETELSNVQFGVRATAQLGSFDVSASYFHGYRTEPTPSAELVPTGAPGEFALRPLLNYDRIDLVGLDFSGVLGDFVLRGEAAYTFTGDPEGTDPSIGNPSFQAVLGGEYMIPGGPRTVVQGIVDMNAPDAGEEAEWNFKAMTALVYEASTRTQLDLAWMHSFDGSGAVLPSASYTFADGVIGKASVYAFYGADGTEFGGWRENTQLRLGLEYSF